MKRLLPLLALSIFVIGCRAHATVRSGEPAPGPVSEGPPPGPPPSDRTSEQRADNQADRIADANSAWDKLGQKNVHGRADHDLISARGKGGPYSKIKLVVESAPLEMYDVLVVFENGEKWSPNVRHTFGPGSTSRTIDLPGGKRNIRNVQFKYGNLPGAGMAQVEVWALP